MSEDLATKPIVKKKKPKNFVNNESLLEEVKKSKERLSQNPELMASAMTPKLVSMLMMMVDRYFEKSNWSGYSWTEEYCADAKVLLCNKWHKFDETRFNNPFAYYTQLIYTSGLGTLEKEKKIQMIRDNVLESRGMTPSFGRQLANEKHMAETLAAESVVEEEPAIDEKVEGRYDLWSEE